MASRVIERSTDEVLKDLEGVRRSLHVERAFGDPVEIEGVVVVPVARVAGGGGGGAGEGPDGHTHGHTDESTESTETSGGMGAGFGLGVRPLGVYQVSGDEVVWKPSVDVDRAIRGGQVLTAILAVCVTLVLLRRSS